LVNIDNHFEKKKKEKKNWVFIMATDTSEEKLSGAFQKLIELEETAGALNKEQDKAERRLLWQFEKKRKEQLYDPRREIVRDIPKFWQTVLDNHPDLSSLLESEDSEVMSFLEEIDLQAYGDIELEKFEISFTFKNNPFFSDKLLKKEFKFDDTRKIISASKVAINWKPGKNLTRKPEPQQNDGKKRRAEDMESTSFFTWFEDDNLETNATIAAVFYDDLWPRAFDYYQGLEDEEDVNEEVDLEAPEFEEDEDQEGGDENDNEDDN